MTLVNVRNGTGCDVVRLSQITVGYSSANKAGPSSRGARGYRAPQILVVPPVHKVILPSILVCTVHRPLYT